MRILLVAYEYPPLESAQSLRWGYLAAELERAGDAVTVVSADLRLPASDRDEAAVTRVFAGPFVGTAARLARRDPGGGGPVADRGGQPGWPERAYRAARYGLDRLLVPDVRTEWWPFAASAVRRIIHCQRPDVIIGSHEPGVDLMLARAAARRFGIPFHADLGDPFGSPFSPRWRRWLDVLVEGRLLDSAASISVTTEDTATLLMRRHGLPASRFSVVPQGFCSASPPARSRSRGGPLTLVYTGTLYARFRDPRPVFEAIAGLERVRLLIAGTLDGIDPSALSRVPNVEYLGRVSHDEARRLQADADVLLNIGNASDLQVPGKIYEYFGACRPILHVAQTFTDPSARLLASLRRGVVATASTNAIAQAIVSLADRAAGSNLDADFDLSLETVARYSWRAAAAALRGQLHNVVGQG
jgi:hypothetical protein